MKNKVIQCLDLNENVTFNLDLGDEDTSIIRTLGLGPNGVRNMEVPLYTFSTFFDSDSHLFFTIELRKNLVSTLIFVLLTLFLQVCDCQEH